MFVTSSGKGMVMKKLQEKRNSTKKQWITVALVVTAVFILLGRNFGIKHFIGRDLKLDLFWGKISFYFDNHDHLWHNDGVTAAVIQFSDSSGEGLRCQIENSMFWEAFPMPEKINCLAYEDSYTWADPSTFAEMVGLPEIKQGYWFFVDQDTYRNGLLLYGNKAIENLEDQEAWEARGYRTREYPGAYALAIYDPATNTLYYFQRNL